MALNDWPSTPLARDPLPPLARALSGSIDPPKAGDLLPSERLLGVEGVPLESPTPAGSHRPAPASVAGALPCESAFISQRQCHSTEPKASAFLGLGSRQTVGSRDVGQLSPQESASSV